MADVESVDCEKMRDDGFLVSKVSFDSRRGPCIGPRTLRVFELGLRL
jgi:hypothetical protein